MKKANILELTFISACAIAAGYFIYQFFIKTPKPVSVVSSTGTVVGTAPASSTISADEKLALFNASRGYTGGAAPPQIVLQQAQAAAAAAMIKIKELDLEGELEQYLKSIENNPPMA